MTERTRTTTTGTTTTGPGSVRTQLSVTQLLAGALAAVSSAVAASFFGVAGTLVGAALGSIVATVATAVYQSSLQRTKGRLEQIVPVRSVVLKARDAALGAPTVRAEPLRTGDAAAVAGAAATEVPVDLGPGRGADGTGVIDTGVTGTGATGVGATGTVPMSGISSGLPPAGPAPSAAAEAATPRPEAPGTANTSAPAGGRRTVGRPSVRWPRVAAAAAGIFVVALGLIFVVELAAGRPLSALMTGGEERGTSVQRVVDPAPATEAPVRSPGRTSPSDEPTGTPSAEVTPSEQTPEPGRSDEMSPSASEPAPGSSSDGPSASSRSVAPSQSPSPAAR